MKCVGNCDEQSCIGQCQREFYINIDYCPCHSECFEGCSVCEHWTCGQSDPSVLILYSKANKEFNQYVLNADGSSRVLDEFKFEDETQIFQSCSVMMNDKMWIFGGENKGSYRRQLLSVGPCALKTEGTLPFDLSYAASDTIGSDHAGEKALMCFNSNLRDCYFFDGENFNTAPSTKYAHMKITLGKFREGLVAISGATSSSELEVEFYDGKKSFWTWQPLFPEEKFDYIWNFSTATVENILYVFGGYPRSHKTVTTGEMIDLEIKWSKGPDLIAGRYGHRSIAIGNIVYLIGGNANMVTEKWTILDNQVTKELLDLELYQYVYYPELFSVQRSYCT